MPRARCLARIAASASTALTVTVIVASCSGGSNHATTRGTSPPSVPRSPGDLAVSIISGGGIVAYQTDVLGRVPQVTILADGRVFRSPEREGGDIRAGRLSTATVRNLLRQARDAGVGRSDLDLGRPLIADGPTTTITIGASGGTASTSVYALGIGEGGLTSTERANRRRLSDFVRQVRDTVAGTTHNTYEPSSVVVLTSEANRSTDRSGTTEAQPRDEMWPLERPLGSGDPLPHGYRVRCFVVHGADTRKVLDQARDAHRNDTWTDGHGRYHVMVRPLLPNEHTCADLVH